MSEIYVGRVEFNPNPVTEEDARKLKFSNWQRLGAGPSASSVIAAAIARGVEAEKEVDRLKILMAQSATERERELIAENDRLREANRRLQQEGPAVERDKLILQLRAQVDTLHQEACLFHLIAGRAMPIGVPTGTWGYILQIQINPNGKIYVGSGNTASEAVVAITRQLESD